MKKSILIKSSGFYLVEWNQETGEPKSQVQIKNQLAKQLGAYAEFDESVTVGTFLFLLNDFVDEIEYIFSYYLNEVDFEEFFQESLLESVSGPNLDYIDLTWKVRLISTEEMNIIDFIPNLVGIREIGSTDMDEVHDLDFIRLRDIAKFKINALTAVDVPDPKTYTVSVEAERRWTLFEIISGFLAEVSKYGTPAEKEEILAEMENSTKMSFTELLEYVDELEEAQASIGQGLSRDDLDDEDEDE